MEMLLCGRRISAEEALRYGLVNKVVSKETIMDVAEEYARDVCRCAPLAVRAAKELAVRSQSLPLEQGLRLEQLMTEVLRTTEDAKEGPAAFAEKRQPEYTGR
jgi:enoyl-CoA hydratase/carnithine racemase